MATFIASKSGTRGVLIEANTKRTVAALRAFTKLVGAEERLPYNRRISLQLMSWVDRNFVSGGALQTPTWAPLAESTRRDKDRRGYSSLPLTRTGALRASFRPFYDRDSAGVGSSSRVARFHQDGTKRMPRRRLTPPRAYVRDTSLNIYGMMVNTSIRRSGLK